MSIKSLYIHNLIWLLVAIMVYPPALLAQTPGGLQPMIGAPQIGVTPPAGAPGQPIVTNPTALQPLTPPQTPCPAPTQFSGAFEAVPPSLNDLWPTDPASLLPRSVEQRIRLEREAREEQNKLQALSVEQRIRQEREAREEQNKLQALSAPQVPAAPSTAPGRIGELSQAAAVPSATIRSPSPPAADMEAKKDLSVEEAFERYSVVQSVKGRLRQFGYEFFDVQASTFAPVLDVPVGPDYVIGPQDTLAVHVWNVPDPNFNRSYLAPVERDGTVVIPSLGAIPVGGLTFSQAERAISDRLRALLKRFEVHVSLARLRTIKVFVVGEVVRPGAYEVSSLATVSNAVYAACGPARSGSLRQVRVVRDGTVVAELDFYGLLLKGDRTQDRRLQAGDVVVVPPLGPAVAVGGAVKRPAIYELRPGDRLSELLRLAGGLTPVADHERCHVFRIEPGRGRYLVDVNLKAILNGEAQSKARPAVNNDDPVLQDGDYVRIGSVVTQAANVVSLAGAVKSPGPYEYRPGMRVGNLLTKDQLTAEAYAEKAEIIRTDPITFQTKVIQFSPKALFEGAESENHPLQRLDQIVLASQVRPPSIVVVEGEVKRPGYYTIETGERLSSVLKRAGGFTPNAFPPGIVLIRESVKRRQQAELERFMTAERQRLAAQSAAMAAGTAGIAGGAALQGTGSIAETQIFALRLQQLEAAIARLELGRVVVRLESIEQLEGTEDDLILEARDKIVIPTPPQTVSVVGSVKNPSNVVYRVGLRLDDYLKQAGGVTTEADTREMYVMRANGSTETGYLRLKDIQPGDTIVVPQKIEAKTPALGLWQAVASIIGSAALAVAGIAVVGR